MSRNIVVFTANTKYYMKGKEAELVDESDIGYWVKRIEDGKHLVASKEHIGKLKMNEPLSLGDGFTIESEIYNGNKLEDLLIERNSLVASKLFSHIEDHYGEELEEGSMLQVTTTFKIEKLIKE